MGHPGEQQWIREQFRDRQDYCRSIDPTRYYDEFMAVPEHPDGLNRLPKCLTRVNGKIEIRKGWETMKEANDRLARERGKI